MGKKQRLLPQKSFQSRGKTAVTEGTTEEITDPSKASADRPCLSKIIFSFFYIRHQTGDGGTISSQ